MMTTAELSAWGVPMLVCPLPTAAHGHQAANAVALERAGAAVHVPQADLTPERLEHEIRKLLADRDRLRRMAEAARARAKPRAAIEIAERILGLLG
jgi:UDP-N-acetylglucosamine--N-acetylmuramyl-(pentapeptide) pyrophosphoryl-undecaprenol N-acetylglucosamine transferase